MKEIVEAALLCNAAYWTFIAVRKNVAGCIQVAIKQPVVDQPTQFEIVAAISWLLYMCVV
jgi:hypothetical protein